MIMTLNQQVFMDESNGIGQCIVVMAKSSQLFINQLNSHGVSIKWSVNAIG
jgi:hypothetical protein